MNVPAPISRPLFAVVLCVLACAIPWGSAMGAQTVHYVDNLGDCEGRVPCHTTIMDAVGAASPYDTIEVFPGVYHEAVQFVSGKDHIALLGRSSLQMPVIAAPPATPGSTSSAIDLQAAGVQVRNFVLEAPQGAGVLHNGLAGSTDALIVGNRISGLDGISVGTCTTSYLLNNWIVAGGIDIFETNGCVVAGNTVEAGSITVGAGDLGVSNVRVLRNNVRNGSILFLAANPLLNNTVVMNQVEGGSIQMSGVRRADGNAIRFNVVRHGGISLGLAVFGLDMGNNTIADNVVSGGPGDGIALNATGGQSLVTGNTSIESAACDIDDSAQSGHPQNTWTDNRFGTRCGAASQ